LEQPVRRLALIGAGALLLAFLAVLVVRTRAAAKAAPDHAFPIPGERDHSQVEVLNGSARPGLARTVTRVLREGGLDVVFFGTAPDGPPADSTLLLVRRGDSSAARRALRLLGTGKIQSAPDTLRRVDLTVIVGGDYTPPTAIHP
jgi:hypothetical protein